MIAKNPAPPPPHLFSLARRRWKDSLVGLLHILPRLGKSGGHIPHSSLPFSYSLRLSVFFFFSLSPPFVFFFFFISVLKPRSFCWRSGGKRMGPAQRGTFWEKRTEWAAGTHRQDASWSCGERQWLNHALWNTSHSSSSSSSVHLLRNVRSAPRHGFR